MSESQVIEIKENKKRKLPFGHFKVMMGKNEEVIKPLTQDEIAEGWQLNLPSFQSFPVHHWSLTLAQLPPHLWKKLRVEYKDGKDYIPIIKNNIYYYSINATKYDNELKKLYYELQKGYNANIDKIKDLMNSFNNEINGWLITRARKFIKDPIHDRYFVDML